MPSLDTVLISIGDQVVTLNQQAVMALIMALEDASLQVFQVTDTLFSGMVTKDDQEAANPATRQDFEF